MWKWLIVAVVGTAIFALVVALAISQFHPELVTSRYWQMGEMPIRIASEKALAVFQYVDTLRSKYPTEYSIGTKALGWVVAGIVLIWTRFRRLFRRKTPLERFFLNQPRVHIVLPSIRGVSFSPLNDVTKGEPIVLPRNAPLLPLGDALGVTAIASFVQSQLRGGQVIVPHYGESANIPGDERFLTIGGASVNDVTRRFMERVGVPGTQFYHLRCVDNGESFCPEHEAPEITSNIVVDYGFIINSATTPNSTQRALLIFGCWPQGTLGAARAIVGQLSSKRDYHALRRSFSGKRDTIAIVKCTTLGLVEDRVEIVKIRPIIRALIR